MKQEMLINVAQPEECRIAIVEDGLLEELYVERTSQGNYVGNIYKGKIVNLEPSIQAAFVDFGVGRNGFLHISDVEPQYFRQGGYDPNRPINPDGSQTPEAVHAGAEHGEHGGGGGRRRMAAAVGPAVAVRQRLGVRPAHQAADPGDLPARRRSARAGDQGRHRHQGPDALHVHQHPRPLPGADAGAGPDRRLAQDRRATTTAAASATSCRELNPPKGVGFIVRTAGTDRTKKELSRDLAYLLRLWKVIVRRIKKHPAPIDIYEESDMIIRTIRDIFTARRRRDLHRRAGRLRAGQGILADRHAAVREPAAASTKARSRCSRSTISTRRSRRSISARCRCAAAGRW